MHKYVKNSVPLCINTSLYQSAQRAERDAFVEHTELSHKQSPCVERGSRVVTGDRRKLESIRIVSW